MSQTHVPAHESGMQANPKVIELTKLSADLSEIKEELDGEFSIPNWVRAAIEGRINRCTPDNEPPILATPPFPSVPGNEVDLSADDDGIADVFCGRLYKFAEGLDKYAKRADLAITHRELKTEIKTAINRIRDNLMIPALVTIIRPFWPDSDYDRDTHRLDAKTKMQLRAEILGACGIAQQEAQVLSVLADKVYVLADHIREQERDLAAVTRLVNRKKTGPDEQVARISVAEANEKAIELAKADRFFVQRSLREWAAAIGCSTGLVVDLPLWTATMKKTSRGKKGKVSRLQAISLTSHLESVVGKEDEDLQRLISDQKADQEPSPLEADLPDSLPKRVYGHKRM